MIVIATNNQHKVRELTRILPSCTILTPGQLGIHFAYPERGRTFMANALGKARHCRQLTPPRYPVLADDSGVCVEALQGRPGVHSARFGRARGISGKDDAGRNALLLRRLTAAGAHTAARRAAHYVCAAVLIDAAQRVVAIQDRWDGCIAPAPSAGARGFGYDPIFIPHEAALTVAELSDAEKDRYSHRGKAFRAVIDTYTARLY